MLKEIRDALRNGPKAPKPSSLTGDVPRIAAAALMVETARKDREFTESERETVLKALSTHFSLSESEASSLLAEAERQQSRTFEDWSFTQLVNQGFSPAEREELVMMLWEVAFADGTLHSLENRLIERIGGDLGVSSSRVETLRAQAAQAKGVAT